MAARKRPPAPKAPTLPRMYLFGDVGDRYPALHLSEAFLTESEAIADASEYVLGAGEDYEQIVYELVPRKRVHVARKPVVESLE